MNYSGGGVNYDFQNYIWIVPNLCPLRSYTVPSSIIEYPISRTFRLSPWQTIFLISKRICFSFFICFSVIFFSKMNFFYRMSNSILISSSDILKSLSTGRYPENSSSG